MKRFKVVRRKPLLVSLVIVLLSSVLIVGGVGYAHADNGNSVSGQVTFGG
jgi:hypothetical protein